MNARNIMEWEWDDSKECVRMEWDGIEWLHGMERDEMGRRGWKVRAAQHGWQDYCRCKPLPTTAKNDDSNNQRHQQSTSTTSNSNNQQQQQQRNEEVASIDTAIAITGVCLT